MTRIGLVLACLAALGVAASDARAGGPVQVGDGGGVVGTGCCPHVSDQSTALTFSISASKTAPCERNFGAGWVSCGTATGNASQQTAVVDDAAGMSIESDASFTCTASGDDWGIAAGGFYDRSFEVTEPVPFRLSGRLEGDVEHPSFSTGPLVSLGDFSSNVTGDFSETGTLQPGTYTLSIKGDCLASVPPSEGGFDPPWPWDPSDSGSWDVTLEVGDLCSLGQASSTAFSGPLLDFASLGSEPAPIMQPESVAPLRRKAKPPGEAAPQKRVGSRFRVRGGSARKALVPRRSPPRVVTPPMVRRAHSGAVIERAAAGSPRVKAVVPAAAVPGAAVLVKGTGLSGKGTRVTVGGKSAKLLAARSKELRVAVPRAKAGSRSLVVKRGRKSSSKPFRVLKPFKGTIGAKPDTKRARSGTIGPSGGEVTATGADATRYTLRLPAGALAAEQTITVTPIARFTGLPFTGGRVVGADLAPDGLQLATPGTLAIEPKQRFPANTLGFDYAAGGAALELQSPTRKGKLLELRIEHFSGAALTTASEADFALIIGPILAGGANLSKSQIRSIIAQIGIFSQTFDRPSPPHPPPSYFFCQNQPLCNQAIQRGLDSLTVLVQQACDAGRANPEIDSIVELLELEGMRANLGAQDDASLNCREQIMASLLGLATFAARADPYGASPFVGGPPASQSDLDGDGQITNFEWLFGLALNAGSSGFSDLSDTGRADAFALIAELPARGRTRCESDRSGGEADLARGQAYATTIDAAFHNLGDVLDAFAEALDFCRLDVQVTPGPLTLAREATQQFTAVVTGLLNPPHNADVTWTATGGTITPTGLYTAPNANGTFQVRATSTFNTSRFGEATVTVEGCPAP